MEVSLNKKFSRVTPWWIAHDSDDCYVYVCRIKNVNTLEEFIMICSDIHECAFIATTIERAKREYRLTSFLEGSFRTVITALDEKTTKFLNK